MKIRALFVSASFLSVLAAGGAWAKAPADATGECKDGTYTQAASREGACSSHGGVKQWIAAGTAPAARPAGSTGECKDGTFTDAASKSGACSGHKGVKSWYGASEVPTSTKSLPEKSATETMPRSTQASTGTGTDRPVNPQPSVRNTSMPSTPMPTTPMAGGGDGKVWVNTHTHVYHCEKDALYGKTKRGEYMAEAAAKSSGSRPARGKTCS